MEFINLKAQYRAYKDEIDLAIQKVLDSATFIGGEVPFLERELENFVGVKHAIACSSGTDALLLALMALDIKENDEVITTPFTFIATAEMIAFIGAKPVFVDIDEKTYNIDVNLIEEKITDKTKAIMPVSLFGQIAKMDEINTIAKKYNLKVIEDGAQSFGAKYNGKYSGNLSDVGTTSFFPAKPLGCYGDGGAVFTNNDELANKMRILLNHGQTERYVHSLIGFNGRLDSIQAAILRVKLKHYSDEIKKRDEIAKYYSDNLKGVITPYIDENKQSVWAQYCIRVQNRDELQNRLKEAGIPTAIYYPIPLHLQEVFRYLNYKEGDFPVSEKLSKDILALPMSAFLTKDEQNRVIEVVNGK